MSQKLPHLTGGIAGVMGGNHDFIGRTRIWGIIYPTYRINIDGFGEITVSKVGYILDKLPLLPLCTVIDDL